MDLGTLGSIVTIVLAPSVPAGIALNLMDKRDYKNARLWAYGTVVSTSVVVFMFQLNNLYPLTPQRIVLNGVIGAVVFVAFTYFLSWIDGREKATTANVQAPGSRHHVLSSGQQRGGNTTQQSAHTINNFNGPVTVQQSDPPTPPAEQVGPAQTAAREREGGGGNGGSATVGGNGVAIGGPGGHAGKYGRGGDGGSAHVAGDGVAVGGEGGSSDTDTLWRPPARSGYEIHQEATGQPVDLKLRQFGRGGMSSGYAARFQVVSQIWSEYFKENPSDPKDISLDASAVPIEYVNEKLEQMDYPWRARMVKYDYEFYIP